ncbi:MAG TPA: type II secretion system protein GspC [Permianibacter sp.]|nr:type II secretion system protein GspC [Permianibacter sp.]
MVASGLPATLLHRFQAVPLRWWQRVLLLLALLWLLATLARASWRVYDALTWTPPPPPASAAAFEAPVQVDIEALVSAELFGSAEIVVPEQSVADAPDSTASLKLLGVYAADNEQKASAIVEETTGAQSVVFVGEPLPGGYGSLKQVFADRIIIDRGGRLETLRMEDLTGQLGDLSGPKEDEPVGKAEIRSIDKRRDAQVAQSLNDVRSKLQTDPASLRDVLSIEPSYDKGSGQLLGYRLGPGKDRKLFGRVGLQRNDLVTAINGVALDDPTRAMALLNDLNSAKELTLTLQRGGQQIDLQLPLQNP